MSKLILYTFRRCPYAIRARMALAASGIAHEAREVSLRSKPEAMLAVSPKGTVPVLLLSDGRVIDESYDIMKWALGQNDPTHWLPVEGRLRSEMDALVLENDTVFKKNLDAYKYPANQTDSVETLRARSLPFIENLDQRIRDNGCLFKNELSIADIAIFPFVRQLRGVDENWFDSEAPHGLRTWLTTILDTQLFHQIMRKRDTWAP